MESSEDERGGVEWLTGGTRTLRNRRKMDDITRGRRMTTIVIVQDDQEKGM
jgi:hypothetical protein